MNYKLDDENKLVEVLDKIIRLDLKLQETFKKEVFIELNNGDVISISQGFGCSSATDFDYQLKIINKSLYNYVSFDEIVNIIKHIIKKE